MKHQINIIKKIDAVCGLVLLKIIPKVKAIKKPENISKILVIRPGGMGDAALLLPVLKEVKLKFPEIIIDILCEQRNSGIFMATPYVDRIRHYHNPLDMFQLLRETYDIIFDTEQSHFLSAIICRILNTGYRVGFDVFGRGKLFNLPVKYRHELYEVESFRALFQDVFNVSIKRCLYFPYFEEKEPSAPIEKIMCSSERGNIVCLFPGATVKERLWPEDRWAEVIDQITTLGFKPVLLGGKMEVPQCSLIEGFCKTDQVFNLSGKLSLIDTAYLFSQADVLISTDSGILHFAVMCDISTLSLFGAGIATKWAPKGEKHYVINKQLDCSPCTSFGNTPKCMRGNLCMKNISSNDVLILFKKIMMGKVKNA